MPRNIFSKRNSLGDPDEFRLSLVEHLDELRSRLIRVGWIVLIAWIVGWVIHDPLYTSLERQLKVLLPKGLQYQEVFHSITDAFMLKLRLSFAIGVALALPLILREIWGFVAPGLKPNERKPFQIVGPVSSLLFALGCYFCWLILPPTMNWFGQFALEAYPGVAINQEAGSLVFFAINMFLGFGLGFQLPIVVFALATVGILPPAMLIKYWRHAVVVIFFLAAIVTPSMDPFSMLMMAIPLCILFALSVVAVNFTQGRAKGRSVGPLLGPTLLD